MEAFDFHGISATPVDRDRDGDFDLILGTTQGRVFLRVNEGSATEPAFATQDVGLSAGGQDMSVPTRHSMPVVADWDGDGRFDLVSGSYDGSVYWFRNNGDDEPEFEAPAVLVGDFQSIKQGYIGLFRRASAQR